MTERPFTTADFPQADRLHQVGLVALAVQGDKHADDEIETFIGLDSGGRQGRYYRLAAEILGLVENHGNFAVLTEIGEEYAALDTEALRTDFLARCLVETPVFRAGLAYIDQNDPTDQELKDWFLSVYPGAGSTADRRFSTFRNYLHEADLVGSSRSRNVLRRYRGGVRKRKATPGETADRPFRSRAPLAREARTTGEVIRVDVDAQKRERANLVHWQLVDSKAAFVMERGWDPYDNQHIDLFARAGGEVVFYEMKSVTPDGSNLLAQVRKAVSQLYEYRYLYEADDARLCIVTNYQVTDRDRWLVDYLVNDRAIAYEWTTDFTTFECHDESRDLLGEFAP